MTHGIVVISAYIALGKWVNYEKFTFRLVSKDGHLGHTKVVYAEDYPSAVNQLSFFIIECGDVIESFTEEQCTHKYVITITSVSLEYQGEWDFTFNSKHVIYSVGKLEYGDLLNDVMLLEIDIQADTDVPYEGGYAIEDFDYDVVLLGGE